MSDPRSRALTLLAGLLLVSGPASAITIATHSPAGSLSSLLSQYPVPVSVSANGKRALYKIRHESDFEIFTREIPSGKLIQSFRSTDTQLSLTWRPDGGMIAFLASTAGNRQFRLYLWDLSNGKITAPDVPITFTAAPPMRWSPDGKQLAYFVGGGDGGDLVIVKPVAEGQSEKKLIAKTGADTDFSWSPDGKTLAYVPLDKKNSISLADVIQNASSVKTFEFPAGTDVRDLAWSPTGTSVLVTVREPADDFFALSSVNTSDGEKKNLIRGSYDIKRPLWTGDSTFVYEAHHEGLSRIEFSNLRTRGERKLSGSNTSDQILGLSQDGSQIYSNRSSLNSPPKIVGINLKSNRNSVLSHSPGGTPRFQRTPKFVKIKSADGLQVPLFVWKPKKLRPNHAKLAVIYIHGGPHIQEYPIWDARTQLAIENGIAWVTVNYRGSKGYGRKFEQHEDRSGQANDVIAAQRYVKEKLKIIPENTILMASSLGTPIATYATALKPDGFGAVVYLSSIGLSPEICPKNSKIRILQAFHGRQDNLLEPTKARENLVSCFGNELFSHPGSQWNVFEDEGHFFHRTGSWAKIQDAILEIRSSKREGTNSK